jgi:type I restriction enzyme S subunit
MKGERFVAAVERTKQMLMRELFSKGIGKNPQNWKFYSLAELCLLIADCPHSTPDFVAKGFLVVRNFNVKSCRLDLTNSFYTTEKEYLLRIQKAKPEEGDILFSREAPCGEACQVPHNLRLSLGQRMMLIRADPNIVDSRFLLYSLYSEYVTRNIDATSIGQTVTRMNVADVKKLKIPRPPLPEQHQIAAILTRCDETIAAARANVEATKTLKLKLIKELFSRKGFSLSPTLKKERVNE